MEGDWVEGTPQWWWIYVKKGLNELIREHLSDLQRANPQPVPWLTGPDPVPWNGVVGAILSAIRMKEVAQRMEESELSSTLTARSDRFISEVIDDFCGTKPRPWPWPPPWVLRAVDELALAANSFEEGSMREEVLRVAGQMLERAASEVR
jgi:hypothetical protein